MLMRLSEEQCSAIKKVVQEALGMKAHVWLFGSRVDDGKRGGDIDLYVETEKACELRDKIQLMTKIQLAIGMRKVDLIINSAGSAHKAIYSTAKLEGMRL